MVETLGQRLKTAMEERKVTIAKLASSAEMSYQGVRKILRDETKEMEASTCAKLAKLLYIDSEWLRTGKGTMEPDNVSPVAAVEARRITESQWALLQDFEILPEDDKQALRSTMRAKAENVRKIVAEYLERQGMGGTATDARVAASYGTPPPSLAPAGSTRQYARQNQRGALLAAEPKPEGKYKRKAGGD